VPTPIANEAFDGKRERRSTSLAVRAVASLAFALLSVCSPSGVATSGHGRISVTPGEAGAVQSVKVRSR